jgi:phosphoglycolate phosphatase-like HAD superfamily hydrolase
MEKKSNIKGIIFDFDGVILDSANIKTEAFLELFKEHTTYINTIKMYHIKNQGITRFKKFEWICEQLLGIEYTESKSAELGKLFSEIVYEKIIETRPIPGAIDLLDSLQDKIHMFIASGTPDDELHTIINRRNLSKYFEKIFGSNHTKIEAVDLIMDSYGFDKSELIFVGDATTDYEAAKARGLHFVAVQSDVMRTFWKNKNILPVDNLLEIKNLIEFNEIQ